MPAGSTDLELAISCSSVSCLINTEPLELLRLQPSELIASESELTKSRPTCEPNQQNFQSTQQSRFLAIFGTMQIQIKYNNSPYVTISRWPSQSSFVDLKIIYIQAVLKFYPLFALYAPHKKITSILVGSSRNDSGCRLRDALVQSSARSKAGRSESHCALQLPFSYNPQRSFL